MSRATQQARIVRRQQEAATRRRRRGAASAVVAVLLVISAMVIAKASTSSSSKPVAAADSTGPAATAVTTALASVPASVVSAVGVGSASAPSAISGAALTSDGKPHIVFVGDEWCPYCAAERWGLVVALSRFGTWSGLGTTRSSTSDVYPSTATLSFHGATFTSDVLSFTGYELQDDDKKPLDQIPSDVSSLLAQSSGGAVPFIDLGGRAVISGASYDPAVLKGKTPAQIAAALTDPSSPITKAVVGTANRITQQLCGLTGEQPAKACAS